MTLIQVSAWLMVSFGGVFSGAILMVAVERVNLWRRMPTAQYVVDFRRSLYRSDPLIPLTGGLSGVAAMVYAWNSRGQPAVLAWLGMGAIAVIIVASVVLAEPINSKFRRLPEGQAPDGVERLRTIWCRFHFARTVVALAAMACMTAAVVVSIDTPETSRTSGVSQSTRLTPMTPGHDSGRFSDRGQGGIGIGIHQSAGRCDDEVTNVVSSQWRRIVDPSAFNMPGAEQQSRASTSTRTRISNRSSTTAESSHPFSTGCFLGTVATLL